MHGQLVVVKLGGSLLNLEGLGRRLRSWLDRIGTRQVVLIVGGGATADHVRQMARIHELNEESCHWLAIRAMSLNSLLIASITERVEVIMNPEETTSAWKRGSTPVLDPLAFMIGDDGHDESLPHSWAVTADSIAARFTIVHKGVELVLLKSISPGADVSWEQAANDGVVDKWFPRLAPHIPSIRIVDFRSEV